MRHTLKYKKDIVKLFLKRAPGVTMVRFAAIHDLPYATVKGWVIKFKGGQYDGEK